MKTIRPVILGFHHGQGRACCQKSAPEIDRHHAVPFFGSDVLDQRPGIDAGILHQDVEAAGALDSKSHGRLDIVPMRDVRCDEAGAEPIRRGLAGRDLGIGNDNLRILFAKPLGDAGADAARRADDERGLVFKTHGHASFCLICSFTVSRRTAASTSAPRIICV